MEESETDVVYLDLSKAFDNVNHLALIRKLFLLGITGDLLFWFVSYSSDKHKRVTLQGFCSDSLMILPGVPQGSILGSLLFLRYINDMAVYIKHNSKLPLFAKYSKLYKTILKQSYSSSFQQDLTCLTNWCSDWSMSFNTYKCKTLNISKKEFHSVRNYYLCNELLDTVRDITDLGISITDNLHWSSHIERYGYR